MNPKKTVGLITFVGLIAVAALALSATSAAAQPERPLTEMVLQKNELPLGTTVLSIGPTGFDDLSQPINSFNSAAFRVHEFSEAYKIAAVGKELEVGHYLYRYQSVKEAEEQARAITEDAFSNPKSQPLRPVVMPDASAAANKTAIGQSIQVTDPETGGVYYWFVGVEERTLMLLVVGGPSNDQTRAAFESFRARVQQR
jgi:Flp pilus assembly protein CpaB